MKRQHINYLVVGVVTIALFGLLGTVLVKIMGRSGPMDDYHIYYRTVGGVQYGTAVFYEGFPVGQVDLVTPERTEDFTRFRVDVSINEGWQIPDNSQATISTGLLAGVAIDIKEGDSAQMLVPGDEIPAVDGVGFMAALNDIANDMRNLSASHIVPMVENLSARLNAITEGLDRDVPDIVGDLRQLVARLNNGAAILESVLDQETATGIDATLDNLRVVSEQALSMSQHLNSASADIRMLVEENRPGVDRSVEHLNLSLETLADRLDGIGYQLEAAGRNMNEFTNAIRKNPGLLLSSQPEDKPEE
jgi:phospholipid/cholesterol/gamma-HCH transport system substrate-binding protein